MTIVHVPPSLFMNQNTPIFICGWWDIPIKMVRSSLVLFCRKDQMRKAPWLYVILPLKQCGDWQAYCSQHLQGLEQADVVSKEEGNLLRVADCYIPNTMAISNSSLTSPYERQSKQTANFVIWMTMRRTSSVPAASCRRMKKNGGSCITIDLIYPMSYTTWLKLQGYVHNTSNIAGRSQMWTSISCSHIICSHYPCAYNRLLCYISLY